MTNRAGLFGSLGKRRAIASVILPRNLDDVRNEGKRLMDS
jgi:hypothetical protein